MLLIGVSHDRYFSRTRNLVFILLVLLLLSGCIREEVPAGEKIYFQDQDCLIMGRSVRTYDLGPAEHLYRIYLLCRTGEEGNYGSDEFLLSHRADWFKITSPKRHSFKFEFCPLVGRFSKDDLRNKIDPILEQYRPELDLKFLIVENRDLCPSS